jgi:hypothetical protein
MPLKLSVTNYKVWEDALKEDKAAGRHPNVEYRVCNLTEFKVAATNYEETKVEEANDPFAASNASSATANDPFAGGEPPVDTDPFEM